MYGPTKLSALIPAHILRVKRCGARDRALSQMQLVVGDHPAVVIEHSENKKDVRLRPAECEGQLIKTILWRWQAPVRWF
ncbi:hypothetical protein NPIL_87611 [Nephila pilipes]|uniref:Uncharacterized protein n=1 Tax=Nephila pilipes TaxID=299642 RepID=A0A8X6QM90_NEPPI|nr:hypothetical protein NPIL_87611 [Nephila pilipes]